MDISEFASRYPMAFHVSSPGAWASIRRHGLLSTSALLDLFDVAPGERRALEAEKRFAPVIVRHPEHGEVVLRDQAPLDIGKLQASLEDMSVGEWLALLNGRVFFWLQRAPLLKLLGAKAYRDLEHEVITFDTNTLLRRHGDRAELAPINTGATLFNAAKRGTRTFRPLAIYDIVEQRKPVELTILGGVPDAADLAVRVDRFRGAELQSVLWERG